VSGLFFSSNQAGKISTTDEARLKTDRARSRPDTRGDLASNPARSAGFVHGRFSDGLKDCFRHMTRIKSSRSWKIQPSAKFERGKTADNKGGLIYERAGD
jgi:hypothetical protein